MAINFAQGNSNLIADNKVVFCGLEYNLTDSEATKLRDILDGMVSNRGSVKSASTLVFPEDEVKHPAVQIVGDIMWQEDFCTVTKADKQYRLYITCPVKGEKGEKIRYAIKAGAKQTYGAVFAGNYAEHEIFWAFPTKKSADAFIASRKEYAKKKGE